MHAHDVMTRLQRLRERLAAAPYAAGQSLLQALAAEVDRNPVLRLGLGSRLGKRPGWVTGADEPPDDLEAWGADAAATLVLALRERRPGRPFAKCLHDGLPTKWNHIRAPGLWSGESGHGRDLVVTTLVDPILDWAETTLGAIPAFSETVRRWAIRVEAFGIAGLPTRAEALEGASVPDEHAFQLDLARFLYDQGFDLGRLGREQLLRERTGQGARIDFLLRDQREVAVELMVARSGSSLTAINHHVVELRDYCRTGGAAHGMLVVVNLDPKRRLDIRPVEITAPSGVQTGGAHLLVTVVEAMRANASAEGGRPVASVDLVADLA